MKGKFLKSIRLVNCLMIVGLVAGISFLQTTKAAEKPSNL
jgi:hypothetical protein